MTIDGKYIHRCLQLAKLGSGFVAPNPMVGAVLVHDDRIIGEGWHQKYGEAHAEVNCIDQAILNGHSGLIPYSTMYVSLEPCAHFGKTAPCCDLIIKNKIPKVVIGCRDPFEEVNARLNDKVGQGKGIEKLKEGGVEVQLADRLLKYECEQLNKRFFTFHTKKRPYVVLKWAQTGDGFIAAPLNPRLNDSVGQAPQGGTSEESQRSRLYITNEYSNRLVHKWRSEEAAILVGTNTALLDDPELTTRLWTGKSPVRMVVDMDLKLPASLKIFDHSTRTIIFNSVKQEERGDILYYKLKNTYSIVPQVLEALYQLKIQSVLVEGGAKLLQSFIDEGSWDEVRIVQSSVFKVPRGLAAPVLAHAVKTSEQVLYTDEIRYYKNSPEL